jgi:hypothetical protein
MAAGESNKGGVELAEQHDFVLCVAGGGGVVVVVGYAYSGTSITGQGWWWMADRGHSHVPHPVATTDLTHCHPLPLRAPRLALP